MRHHISFLIFVSLFFAFVLASCQGHRPDTAAPAPQGATLLMNPGSYPFAILHEGKYYFTCQSEGETIGFRVVEDLHELPTAEVHTVWTPDSPRLQHIWAPEIHRINDSWYIYFEGDDGNTDDHQLYVLECTDADPVHGHWHLCGTLRTNEEWNFGLHPTVLQMPGGALYLLWSGWPSRRAETETQCIYIARMSDPCTVGSQRVLLSKPDLEWERQWINPDGSRAAYPIYVNENPQAFLTPDGRHVCIFYSASGIWSVYNALGCLTALADANLLDPAVWNKTTEPICIVDSVFYGTSNICIVPEKDGGHALLFEAKSIQQGQEQRAVYLKSLSFNADGLPDL
ncbi:MAG: glycoside hydrolase family 43 protein [Bacteroidaceae bacterium]|nr:glycoside hydrolase family 43 protein [Bacteroidaceae bacterium]